MMTQLRSLAPTRILTPSLALLLAAAVPPVAAAAQEASGGATLRLTDGYDSNRWTGASYYVDSKHGSDAWDGRSPWTAWATLQRVREFDEFQPGDAILLARGSVWREELRVPASGSAEDPLLFTSYGTGPQPLILGSDVVDGWQETTRAGVWVAPVSWKPNQLFESGARVAKVAFKGSGVPELEPGTWSWDDAQARAFLAPSAEGAPEAGSIELSRRSTAIEGHHESHVIVHDIAVGRARLHGISVNDGSHWVVDRVTAYGNWLYGVKSGPGATDVRISNSKATDNLIGMGGFDVSGLIVRGNESYDNDGRVNGDGIQVSWCDDVLIEDNISRGNTKGGSADGIQAAGCQAVVIRFNRVEHNENAGIIMTLGDEPCYGEIYGNVVVGAKLGIAIMTDGERTRVFNNTVINDREAAIKVSQALGSPQIVVQNNILFQSAPNGTCLSVPGPFIGFTTTDHNCLVSTEGALVNWASVTYDDLASFRAVTGQGANSVDEVPGFVDQDGGDFRVRVSSSCIDSGTEMGMFRDIAGVHAPQDGNRDTIATIDMGAFELEPEEPTTGTPRAGAHQSGGPESGELSPR